MKIITCIKQVPASTKVDVDPKTGVLIRDSRNVKMNPYDLYALEASFKIKEKVNNCIIEAITMGPPSAKKVLEEALYMGSDEAMLLSDRAFAGADVLATAYSLSQLIRNIGDYELIICGKQTTDGDTAQVGPEIAEFLGISHIPYVSRIIEVKEKYIVVRSDLEHHSEIIQVNLPCLLTISEGDLVPRLPSYNRKIEFKDYKIKSLSLKDLQDQDKKHYGLEGSPTQVQEIFPPNKSRESVRVTGNNKVVSLELFKILKEKKFI